jgi:hypothetical protein
MSSQKSRIQKESDEHMEYISVCIERQEGDSWRFFNAHYGRFSLKMIYSCSIILILGEKLISPHLLQRPRSKKTLKGSVQRKLRWV